MTAIPFNLPVLPSASASAEVSLPLPIKEPAPEAIRNKVPLTNVVKSLASVPFSEYVQMFEAGVVNAQERKELIKYLIVNGMDAEPYQNITSRGKPVKPAEPKTRGTGRPRGRPPVRKIDGVPVPPKAPFVFDCTENKAPQIIHARVQYGGSGLFVELYAVWHDRRIGPGSKKIIGTEYAKVAIPFGCTRYEAFAIQTMIGQWGGQADMSYTCRGDAWFLGTGNVLHITSLDLPTVL